MEDEMAMTDEELELIADRFSDLGRVFNELDRAVAALHEAKRRGRTDQTLMIALDQILVQLNEISGETWRRYVEAREALRAERDRRLTGIGTD
jgi:prefoldin subunit 5